MKKIKLVYIVEDDAISSYLIKSIVDESGSVENSIVFKNGKLAFNALITSFPNQAIVPELILLDLNMPVMDGWEFLDTVHKIDQYTTIPIYILSSSIAPEDIAKSKEYINVKGFITKPLTLNLFKKIILKE